MTRAHDFGRVLTKIREAQGYKTAHTFYKECGGRKTEVLHPVTPVALPSSAAVCGPRVFKRTRNRSAAGRGLFSK